MIEDKVSVMVVEPNKEDRDLYIRLLSTLEELDIEGMSNGREAFEKIKRFPPDILVANIDIPDMDGIELCRKLKSDPDSELCEIYVIIISERKGKDEKIRCMSEGADDYLTKPVDPDELIARVKVAARIATHTKRTDLEYKKMFSKIDVLLIQEGGCAPGYNPVTAFITYHLESMGRKVYATKEGFRSLVQGKDEDFVRLVYDPELYKKLDHIPGVIHVAPLSEAPGALLRGERYPDFKKKELQKKAAKNIIERDVKVIVAIGGNGTFKGISSLCDFLPTGIQVFFVPVTIDSDIAGTECIGENTGIEMGAEKIRRYMADARTHKRVYIIEMMGASSGFHALHSCLGARAHLAVLPNSKIDHKKVVEAINKREDGCVIVVAEGYKREERNQKNIKDNAAEYFYKELLATGIPIKRRVVCEPFSRDIRGATPNNQDITLAQRMAYNVARYIKAGASRLMPAVSSGREYAIPFSEIRTDNMVEEDLLILSDRLTNRGYTEKKNED